MLSKVTSCALIGLEGAEVSVEVDISRRLGSFVVVGLPDAAISESRECVRAAIKNSGLHFPGSRITVSLAPADLRKEGPAYDLPIAIGLLAASAQMPLDLERYLFVGELSLDGSLRHTNGILPMASLAQARGYKAVFVPEKDAREAALIPGIELYPVGSLNQIVAHFLEGPRIAPYLLTAMPDQTESLYKVVDFQEVKGQEHVKRALEIAAAGGHNLFMAEPKRRSISAAGDYAERRRPSDAAHFLHRTRIRGDRGIGLTTHAKRAIECVSG